MVIRQLYVFIHLMYFVDYGSVVEFMVYLLKIPGSAPGICSPVKRISSSSIGKDPPLPSLWKPLSFRVGSTELGGLVVWPGLCLKPRLCQI